jgi:hypothetical protein
MKIIIEAVPKSEMRYATWGDWFQDGDCVKIQVMDDLDPDIQFLVALHELVEVKLCVMRGISQQQVDDFDMNFQGLDEPGDHPDAPYRKEHRQAMLIEHMMASFMGFSDYGRIE